MTESDIFKKIQDIVNANPVIVLGSGASISYGIASMSKLSEVLSDYFSTKTYSDAKSSDAVSIFLDNINTKKMGLEDALLDIQMPLPVENDIRDCVWNEIQKEDVKVYERVVNGEILALSNLLDYMVYDRADQIVNIVTTNYDRIAEYAVSQTNAHLNTCFSNKPIGTFDISLQQCKSHPCYVGSANVLKVHGSLDWFEKDGNLLSFMNVRDYPKDYNPCIITPGTNKYEKTSQLPYRDLMQQMDDVFKSTSGFLCIGYGFNDIHVHPNLLSYSQKRKKPILIVTKDITDAIQNKVINANTYPYIIISDNGGKGTLIHDSIDKVPLEINGKDYWNISGLLEIIK